MESAGTESRRFFFAEVIDCKEGEFLGENTFRACVPFRNRI